MPNTPAPSDQFVQSLARGLAVIEAFGAEHPELTLTEVAARTGLTRAAARRFLLTLVELGFARQTDGRFTLTPRVLRLGTAYLSGWGLPEVAQPHLEQLAAKVGEATSVAVLDGTDVVYVARVATRRILSVGITVGTRFPAHATSLGRVLLAGLSEPELADYFAAADLTALTDRTTTTERGLRAVLRKVRADGFAETDQELAAGLRSLAAPIHDANGAVIAALNVSSTPPHRPREEFADALLATAAAITEDVSAAGIR